MSKPSRERHCDRHGPYTAHYVVQADEYSRCRRCKDEKIKAYELELERQRLEAHARDMLRNTGIPPRYQGRTFQNFRTENQGQKTALHIAKTYVQDFDARFRAGCGLIFCGPPGTGKTHLAAAIAQELAALGRPVRYETFMEAVRDIRATWSSDAVETERQAFQKRIRPDLLLLDEIGVQRGTEAEQRLAFEIINGRYNAMKPTVLISNLPVDELHTLLGDRVIDRMKEGSGTDVMFAWESYRERVSKDPLLPTGELTWQP